MKENISTNREILSNVIDILRDLSKGKPIEQKLAQLEKIFDHIPSELEALGELLRRDKDFNAALRKMDKKLIREASHSA